MKNHFIYSYDSLINSDNWTTNFLLWEEKKEEERTPLKDLVMFNRTKLDKGTISPDRDYSYVEIKSISTETGEINPTFISGRKLPTRAKLHAAKGDIILSVVRPERGTLAIIPPELDGCIVSNTFVVLTPKKISSQYLYLLLNDEKVRHELSLLATGTRIPTLSLKQLKNYSLPIKDVPDDMEKQANSLYSSWKRKSESVHVLSDVIESVFAKELLQKEDDGKGENAQSMILAYDDLDDRLDVNFYMNILQREVEWFVPSIKLGSVCEFKIGTSIRVKKEIKNKDVPYIRVQDLNDNSIQVDNNSPVYISKDLASEYLKYSTSGGNILITRGGASVGKSALVADNLDGAIINQHLVNLKVTNESINPKFLAYYLKTRWAKQQFRAYSFGGNVNSFIQLSHIKEFEVPVPTMNKQEEIIKEIEQNLYKNDVVEVQGYTSTFIPQIQCVEAILDEVQNGQKRCLVQMATGTGKTMAMITLIKRLSESGEIKRAFYLTDRKIMAEQFTSLCEQHLSTTPYFLENLNEEQQGNIQIAIGLYQSLDITELCEFDLIIANNINHFGSQIDPVIENLKSIVVGVDSAPLTAQTLQSFNVGEPTFIYTLNDAMK
ncbi:restriction endonuclease subunit S [Virgibacillus halodenitrificans]|uniref:restriction endonuclease subunit S n=1 Tax=Virgibacillus halodenitrificans TaxID=1482 RepID=UPI002DB83800|nr:restriction endonuclease subunit S [Virgibacillus halodenitrificans]MEC2158011.1 restriction endonuclease subunit S [Virgibacillus halodenitrificans]